MRNEELHLIRKYIFYGTIVPVGVTHLDSIHQPDPPSGMFVTAPHYVREIRAGKFNHFPYSHFILFVTLILDDYHALVMPS